MMSPNAAPLICDCDRPSEPPSDLAPPLTSTMMVLGRKIWPAMADALPRNTNRRVKSIRVSTKKGVHQSGCSTGERKRSVGYVELVLVDDGRVIGGADNQRVPA